ncbi:MAG TPA: hypothetical protein VMW36_03710, partial [Patescibacteria group bacterium]|nr:hypothetical protein [Patescibacteria group bacterium]
HPEGKTKVVTSTIPLKMIRKIDRMCKKNREFRSNFFVEALRKEISRREKEQEKEQESTYA